MGSVAQFWPGGIPEHIRCNPEPIYGDELKNEIQGWQLFLEENAVARGPDVQDPDFEVQQRRTLVDKWASMDQPGRDGYQARAPERPRTDWYPAHLDSDIQRNLIQYEFCNALLEHPVSPRNRALWTKMRILTYHLDGEDGPMFNVAVLEPNPAGPNPITPETFLRHVFVEAARFGGMAMTSRGTVIFHHRPGGLLFVDQQALDTGRALLCDFESNGALMGQDRIWPILSLNAHNLIVGLGKSVEGIVDDNNDFRWYSQSLNMEQPILDILDDILERASPRVEGDIDGWMDDIERYAPGYLAMEEAAGGMVSDYDHAKFRTWEQLQHVPRAEIPD